VDPAFQHGDVIETELLKADGDVTGAGAKGAVDEHRARGIEGAQALLGLLFVEVIDVVGTRQMTLEILVLHAAVDDLEAGLGVDQGFGGSRIKQANPVRERDRRWLQGGGRLPSGFAGHESKGDETEEEEEELAHGR